MHAFYGLTQFIKENASIIDGLFGIGALIPRSKIQRFVP